MLRFLRIFVEFIAAFMGLILLVLALVIWRLNDRPINSTFLTPYIESGIERTIPDAHAQVGRTLLSWDNIDHTMAFKADGIIIRNGREKIIAQIPDLDIRLSLLGLAIGQFWPVEMTVTHPQIKLYRYSDGRVFFADMTTASDTETDTRDVLKRTMLTLTNAYAMRHLVVYNAVVDVNDATTHGSWSVSVPEISLQRDLLQLTGHAKIDLTQKDNTAVLQLRYAYDSAKSLHKVSSHFSGITPAQLAGGHPETLGLDAASMIDMPLSGELEIAFNPDLDVSAAAAKLRGDAGFLRMPDLWDKPRSVKSIDVEGMYDRLSHRLNLVTAAFDFNGAKIGFTASGHAPANAKKYDLDYSVTTHIENCPMDSLTDLWPKPLIPDAREWVTQHMSKGSFDSGEVTLQGSLAWHDLANVDVASGKGTVTASHGSVSYIDGMPSAENVGAVANFDLKEMTINVTSGGIGAINVEPFTATMTGLAEENQFIDIPLKATGPIPDIVTLIDHPPLRYAHAVGLDADTLSGTAEGSVDLRFPLLKSLDTKDIAIGGSAQLKDVASSKLVSGVDITQGNFVLSLDKDGFSAAGPLAINGVPLQLVLQQYFHAMKDKPMRKVALRGVINDPVWKTFGSDFTGTRGNAELTFELTQNSKTKAAMSGAVDLTATDLHFEPLNWKKPPNVAAKLSFDGDWADGKDIVIKSILLRGSQANAEGTAVISDKGFVKSANFDPLEVGRTSISLAFTQTEGDEGALKFEAHGKSLDISGLKGGKDPARADPRPKEYHLNVEKLFTSDYSYIADVEASAVRDGEGWSSIDFHGRADGEHQVDILLTPQPDGTRTFSILCDDFGKLLKGFGFTDTVKEGKVKIAGASTVEHPRVVEGTVKIGSFSVGKLPVLALLLNATSPFGYSGLITDTASFEHMNGNFRWSGDEVDLKHVNAAGTSVGMNINGKVDMNSGLASLRGTLVPFSMVNRILGSIPLLGDILTGGDGGGILAVSYGIDGSLADPKIDVHPELLLTPGFLRNIFFDDGDDTDEDGK